MAKASGGGEAASIVKRAARSPNQPSIAPRRAAHLNSYLLRGGEALAGITASDAAAPGGSSSSALAPRPTLPAGGMPVASARRRRRRYARKSGAERQHVSGPSAITVAIALAIGDLKLEGWLTRSLSGLDSASARSGNAAHSHREAPAGRPARRPSLLHRPRPRGARKRLLEAL